MKPNGTLTHNELDEIVKQLKEKYEIFGYEDLKAALNTEIEAEIHERKLDPNKEISCGKLCELAIIAASHLDEHLD